jgi:hypothetical protein
MRRRTTLVLAGLCLFAGAVAMLGGAETGNAGPRVIDQFTVTSAPTPAQLGRRVAFTIHFRQASNHPLTHVELHTDASDGATFSAYSASRGTCAVVPGDSSKVTCTFEKLQAGDEVTVTEVFDTPPNASGDTSMALAAEVRTNERKGDPGSQSIFFPDPNPTVIGLEPQSANLLSDVLDPVGGTRATDAVTTTNETSTVLTVPSTSTFEPIVIFESLTDADVCGDGPVTPRLDMSAITAPGSFLVTPLTIVLDLRKDGLPAETLLADVKGCHDGFVLDDCPPSGALPAEGCLQSKVPATVGSVDVFRLTMLGPSNGRWAGGS